MLLLLLLHLLLLLGCCLLSTLVVVVVVVALEQFFAQFLLSFVDVLVQFVAVLTNREFLIVINRDVDLALAVGLVLG